MDTTSRPPNRHANPSTTAVARASRGRRRRTRERVRGMSEGAKRPSESAGEGVAVTGARLSQRRLSHTITNDVSNRLGRVWRSSVRVSCGRLGHAITNDVSNRPRRVWLQIVSGSHTVVSVTRSPHAYRIGRRRTARAVSGRRRRHTRIDTDGVLISQHTIYEPPETPICTSTGRVARRVERVEKRSYSERRLRAFVVVGGLAGERRRHPAGAAEVAVCAGTRTSVGVDGLDLGDLFDHPRLDRLDRHR